MPGAGVCSVVGTAGLGFGASVLNLFCLLLSRRLLYSTNGYPHCFGKLSGGGDMAASLVSKFKKDLETWKAMKAIAAPSKKLAEMLSRSLFDLPSVQQFVVAFEETGWTIHADIVALAACSGRGIITTKPVEDVHNVQKNCEQAKAACKWRRPQRAMAVAIARKVLSKRHKYVEVPDDVQLNRKSLCLKASAFGKEAGKPSLSTTGIATCAPKASYFSPSVANSALPMLDLVVAQDMQDEDDWSLVHKTFIGCFCEAEHCIVFKRAGGVGPDFSWHVGLTNWQSSGILAWPVRMVSATPTARFDLVKFDYNVKEPTVLSILSWAGITGRACEWQSWGTQVKSIPNISKHQVRERQIYTTTAPPLPQTLSPPHPGRPLSTTTISPKPVVV